MPPCVCGGQLQLESLFVVPKFGNGLLRSRSLLIPSNWEFYAPNVANFGMSSTADLIVFLNCFRYWIWWTVCFLQSLSKGNVHVHVC